MGDDDFEENLDNAEEDAGEQESSEEAFLKGYTEEDEVPECAECGKAVKEEKKVSKEWEGEEYTFCSKHCAEDFEEEMK